MDYKTKVNDLMWSGNRKILRWDRANFFDLLGQMTAQEIEIMNAYLDSEGYDIKGLSDSQEAYREDVLITYIKDWLKLTVEVDAVDKTAMNNVVLTPYNEDTNNEGYPIGQPTVKELIAILSQLPEDYRVTCCGAENYLYLFEDAKCITIDNEAYLG